MQPPIGLFNLGYTELVILVVVLGMFLLVPITVGVVLWAVFRSRGPRSEDNE